MRWHAADACARAACARACRSWPPCVPASCPVLPRPRRGILAAEEEKLYKLRQEREGEARKALNEERAKLERESRETMVGR